MLDLEISYETEPSALGFTREELLGMAKGDTVSLLAIEKAYAVSRDSGTAWQFAVLRARSEIEAFFLREHDVRVVVASDAEVGLRILTDSEAIGYTRQQEAIALRRARRNHVKRKGIDRANITDDERTALDRDTLRGDRIHAAIRSAARKAIAIVIPKPSKKKI